MTDRTIYVVRRIYEQNGVVINIKDEYYSRRDLAMVAAKELKQYYTDEKIQVIRQEETIIDEL